MCSRSVLKHHVKAVQSTTHQRGGGRGRGVLKDPPRTSREGGRAQDKTKRRQRRKEPHMASTSVALPEGPDAAKVGVAAAVEAPAGDGKFASAGTEAVAPAEATAAGAAFATADLAAAAPINGNREEDVAVGQQPVATGGAADILHPERKGLVSASMAAAASDVTVDSPPQAEPAVDAAAAAADAVITARRCAGGICLNCCRPL